MLERNTHGFEYSCLLRQLEKNVHSAQEENKNICLQLIFNIWCGFYNDNFIFFELIAQSTEKIRTHGSREEYTTLRREGRHKLVVFIVR